mgnify:CR=1 FL=1
MADTIDKYKKVKYWRCPDCSSRYKSLPLLINHTEKEHKDSIPDGVTTKQYLFNRRNHKSFQICVICKKNKTKWNEEAGRYNRFCSEECKAKAAKIAEDNLKKKTGKTRSERLKDPETQKEMMNNRSISGEYTFINKVTKLHYVGSYELDFLKFYDVILKGDPLDLMECPFTFDYIYENEKHVYIPDFYIATLNLIIEIKDGKESNQTNQAIIDSSQVKEKFKDQAVIDSGKFNFIKIRDKNYDDFINAIAILKERNMSGDNFDPLIINPER